MCILKHSCVYFTTVIRITQKSAVFECFDGQRIARFWGMSKKEFDPSFSWQESSSESVPRGWFGVQIGSMARRTVPGGRSKPKNAINGNWLSAFRAEIGRKLKNRKYGWRRSKPKQRICEIWTSKVAVEKSQKCKLRVFGLFCGRPKTPNFQKWLNPREKAVSQNWENEENGLYYRYHYSCGGPGLYWKQKNSWGRVLFARQRPRIRKAKRENKSAKSRHNLAPRSNRMITW